MRIVISTGNSAAIGIIALSFFARDVYAQSAPDTIYINGTVVTMANASRSVQAVAVHGDRIAAVGSTADIQKSAGPNTKVVDLRGATMLPGLIDAHSHFPAAGVSALYSVNLAGPPLGDVRNMDDLVDALRRKAAST